MKQAIKNSKLPLSVNFNFDLMQLVGSVSALTIEGDQLIATIQIQTKEKISLKDKRF